MIEHIWDVLSYAGAILAGTLVKLIWDKIRGIEKKAQAVEDRAQMIEKNYITRFENMQSQLTSVKEEIISKIADLRLSLAENYVTKSETPRRSKKQ